MSKAILSVRYPQFAEKLSALGYEIIPSETVDCLIPYEQQHADIQCLFIDDTAFVMSRCQGIANALKSSCNVVLCEDNIRADYPHNVALNAAVAGKNVICRADSLDKQVKTYCKAHEYSIIDVKQGYAKCSCAFVSDNAVITEDQSIYRTLCKSKIDVLLIGKGSVVLEGADVGFIGGASGYDSNRKTLYFCGKISSHPDYPRIAAFCEKHGTRIIELSDGAMTDIGSIIFC